MIRHIVHFNLKPEVDSADRDRLFEQIKSVEKVTPAKRLQIGRLLDPREDWYKPRLNPEYQWALTMEFDTEDDLYVYQKSPDHEVVAAELRKRVSGPPRIVDFVSQ